MKNKRNLLFLLGGIILGVTIMGIVICFTIGKLELADKVYTAKVNSGTQDNKEDTEVQEKQEDEKITVYELTEKVEKVKESVKEKVTVVKEEVKKGKETKKQEVANEENTSKITVEDIEQTKEEVSEEIVNFVEKIETEILTEENINKVLQTAKTSFITITDFIFYGTEINGHTFEELTEEAKAQIITIAMEIDATLENIRPGYKDEIKLGVSNFIDKATVKYLEVSDKICTQMGQAACNQAKKDLEVMKESFGLTVDLAKVLTQKGLDSLKSWYEIFRESK